MPKAETTATDHQPSQRQASWGGGILPPVIVLLVALVGGLMLRIYMAGTPGYVPDLLWFFNWADAAHRVDLGAPYRLEGRLACNYPPGYILVLSRVPWLYEVFTGQKFRQPGSEKGQPDPAEAAMQRLSSRRQIVKTLELIDGYLRSKGTPAYRDMMEKSLLGMRLITPEDQRRMRESLAGHPEVYDQIVRQAGDRLRAGLARAMPYDVPDRLRQLAVWIKLPALLFDLAGAAALFVLLRRVRGAWPALALSVIYLFLPGVIYNSACWGQVDAVHSLLMLLCLACLVTWRPFWVGVLFGAAMLTKFQSIVLAPVLLAVVLRKCHEMWVAGSEHEGDLPPKRIVLALSKLVGGLVVSAVVILIPFAARDAAGKALDTYVKAPGQYHWVSVCAFNPWWLMNSRPDLPRWYYVFTPEDQVPFLGPIAPKHIGLLLLASFSLWVVWVTYRRGSDSRTLAAAGAAMAMGFFVLPTEIHERYGFPAMILAAWLVGAGWRYLPGLLLLAVGQFYNFSTVQPIEDSRFAWLMPMANAIDGHGTATYVLVLIHTICLVYFCVVLWRAPVSPVVALSATKSSTSPASRDSRRRTRRR